VCVSVFVCRPNDDKLK